MTLPRIPTFEELLKRVKQPKVTVKDLTEEEFDADGALKMGFKIPFGWKLHRNEEGFSLISPRGLNFKNLKADKGKIVDFQAFRGDKPVKFPKAEAPPEPPVEPFKPPEPPPVEPLVWPQPSPPPELPITTARMTEERPMTALPPGFEMPTGELRPIEDILRRHWGEEAITRMSPETKRKEAEEILRIERERKPEGYEVPLSRMPFSEQLEAIGEVTPFRQIGEALASPEAEAVKQVLGLVGMVGTLIYGAYYGVQAIAPLTKDIGNKVLQTALNTGLDKWIAQRSRGVPPQYFKRVQDTLYNLIARDRIWLQQRATENMLKRQGRTPNVAQAARQAVEDTIRDVDQRISALVPRGTQTGALAFGGLPEPTIQSVAAKIMNNQVLTAVERQFYANQSQAVEDALKARVVPTEVTPEVEAETIERFKPALVITQHQTPFLLPDGFSTNPNIIHNEKARELVGEPNIGKYMQQTSAIRVSGGVNEINIEMQKLPTEAQFESLEVMAGDNKINFDISSADMKVLKSGTVDNFADFRTQVTESQFLKPPVKPAVTPEEIAQVTATARATGAIGAKAITPKFVSETSQVGETILDFGSGKNPIHTNALREQGFDVTAFDVGANVVEGIHDVNALAKTYDTVFASNVINVAPSEAFLRKTLGEIKSATKPDGRALFNYPISPRKLELSNDEMMGIIKEFFPSVERVGGTNLAPLWEGKPKPPEVRAEKLSKEARDLLASWLGTQPVEGQPVAVFTRSVPNSYGAGLEAELLGSDLVELVNGGRSLRVKPSLVAEAELVAKGKPIKVKPSPEAVEREISPVKEEARAIPPTEPQKASKKVKAIQKSKEPENVLPEDAKNAHIELAAPDGPKPPKPPKAEKEADDIFKEITEKGYDERVDQTLLRLHEAAIGNETRRTNITIKAGGEKLRAQDIGVWRRAHLIPKPKDIAKLDELYVALHNPSGVEAGEVKVPEGLEEVYDELRGLADWETAALLDFDPKAATIDDWFFRGWKPPQDMFVREKGMLGVKPKALRTPRVDATYQEMRDLGFEPLFWNPYEQWGYRHILGVKYREQMELVRHLKGLGEELIRPHDGGPIPTGWRVPEVGPAFEGKPFAIKDPDTGELGVMFTRRWITEGKIANSLENIYGKRPDLGKFVVRGRVIDPMAIIDAITFIPKRAKLFLSYFQQVDFLTRAGAGSWSQAVDALLAGKPIESVKAIAKYPITFAKVLQANFSPTARLNLSKQLDNTDPIIQGRPGINLKGISEAGLSTRDVTIFPADMDKLVREVADETGILAKGKRIVGAIGDLESAMRRGLFDGVYPAAIITDIQNNIAPMVARQHPSLNDAQINSIIARIANIKYSTIPASQSVIQNRVLRETLRRLFFSIGESEGLLRQATGTLHGPNKKFWWKHYMGVYLFLITVATIISYASTGEPLPPERYSPIAKDKWGPLPFGYNTEFAAPTLPFKGRGGAELTLDLAGQMDTAFRVLDPVNFIASRESVPVRAVTNQVSGTDFYGAPIDDVGPGGIVSRTSQLLHDLFAPIGLGGITGEAAREFLPGGEDIVPRGEERLGYGGQALQATGINIRAETTMNLLDRHAKESGMLKADGTPVQKWDDLEPHQKNELTRNEELETELGLRSEAAVERQQLGALGFSTLDNLDKERIVRGEALVSELYTGVKGLSGTELSSQYDTFREEATNLKREISIRKAQVDEDFQLFKKTGKIEKDPNKRALSEYYNTYDLAKMPSGVIDWDKQSTLEAMLRRKWTDAQESYVDRNIGLTEWGPLFNRFEQDRRVISDSGYWDTELRDKFLTNNPDIEVRLLMWGYRTTPTTLEAAIQLEEAANTYGIPLDSIQAFSKTDKDKERLPSDKTLWEAYFAYYDLPGQSYLAMSQEQVDEGLLPEKHREAWEAYNKAKTDTAKSLLRRKYKEAAYSKWREDFRRANPEFDQWLVDQKDMKPLAPKAISRTGKVSIAPVSGFVGGVTRPRRAKVTYPKFPKPKMGIKVPSVPGF